MTCCSPSGCTRSSPLTDSLTHPLSALCPSAPPDRRYVLLRASVLLSQSRRRMVLCRRAFLGQKRAALTIQCASRAQAARVRAAGIEEDRVFRLIALERGFLTERR